MADILDSLVDKPEVDLDAFSGRNDAKNKTHAPSDKNRAAIVAALSRGGNTAEVYKQVKLELETDGETPTGDRVTGTIKEEFAASDKEALIPYLADPDVDDESKKAAVLKVTDKNYRDDYRTNLATGYLTEDVSGEGVDAESARLSVAGMLGEINQYKRDVQSLLVDQAVSRSPENLKAIEEFSEEIEPFFLSALSKISSTVIKETLGEDAVEVVAGSSVEVIPLLEGAVFKSMGDEAAKVLGDDSVKTTGLLLGSSRAALKDALRKVPLKQRAGMASKILEVIDNTEEVAILLTENDYTKHKALRTMVEEDYYTDSEAFVDNMFSVLDIVFLGSSLRTLSKGLYAGSKAQKLIDTRMDKVQRALKQRLVKDKVQPASLAKIAQETNPDKARALHKAAVEDETGEVAEAAYGTTREDVIAHDLLPDIKAVDGVLTPKVQDIEGKIFSEADQKVMDMATSDGAIYITEGEKLAAREKVYRDFTTSSAVIPNKAMTQIGEAEEGGIAIRAVYGSPSGGFSSAQEAVEQTRFALRKYGVKDEEIKVLERRPEGYVEVEGIPDKAGDYQAVVNYKTNYDASLMAKYETLDVMWNFFDQKNIMTGNQQGSVQKNLLDAGSMLDPVLVGGASNRLERAAGLERSLLEIANEFGKGVKKLPKARENAIMDYIREANLKNIPLKLGDLKARGFDKKEIDVLKTWREGWDHIHFLENRLVNGKLRSRGFQILESKKHDIRLFAKPLSINKAKGVKEAVDPITNEIVTITPDFLKKLEDEGGEVALLNDSLEIGGNNYKHVISRNNTSDGYLRGLRDDDTVLAYREGYYSVKYNAPFFIDRIVKTKEGETFTKAVAMSGNRREAELEAKRLTESPDIYEYVAREDKKGITPEDQDFWDIQQSGGRSSQRYRGSRLEEVSEGGGLVGSEKYVENPVDALITSIRSVSEKTSLRDFFEISKQRFLEQFAEVLPHGKNKWPSSQAEIGFEGKKTGKMVGDARSTWEYINTLENGYINSLDDNVRKLLNSLADTFGGRVERGIRKFTAGKGVTGHLKSVAFQSYIVLNPARQLVLQAHQAVQLTPNFPGYVMSGKMVRDQAGIMLGIIGNYKTAAFMSGRSVDEVKEMAKQFERSGLAAGIDKSNLIQGSMHALAERPSVLSKSVVGKAGRFVRSVGYDSGELFNRSTAWSAFYDKALKANGGKKLNQAQLDKVVADATNYTYNMNRAGDMPYNNNALALAFQFIQVPHKALTTMLFNRGLSRAEKAKLIGFNLLLTPTIGAAFYSQFPDALPENPEARDIVLMGLEGYALNWMFSAAYGQEVRSDFSALAASDVKGLYEFFDGLISSDLGEIVSQSPSVSLFFGNNPRITNAFKKTARYFNVVEDFENPTTFLDVTVEYLKIMSMGSNIDKGRIALEARKRIHNGNVIDEETSAGEAAILGLLGFDTFDAAIGFANRKKVSEKKKAFKEDVTHWYKELKAHLHTKVNDPRSVQWRDEAFSEAWRYWPQEDAKEILRGLIVRDMQNGNDEFIVNLIKSSGWMTPSEIRNIVNTLPDISEEERQTLRDILDNIDSQQNL